MTMGNSTLRWENSSIILAADCDYSREVLAGYENAYFFNPFKPEELAILMKKIISNDIIKKETKSIYSKEIIGWDYFFSIIE